MNSCKSDEENDKTSGSISSNNSDLKRMPPPIRTLKKKKELEEKLNEEFDVEAMEELEDIICFRNWKQANAQSADAFARDMSGLGEIHSMRRKYLKNHQMNKYLEKLRGGDFRTLWIAVLACLNNLLLAYMWSKQASAFHMKQSILYLGSITLVGGSIQGIMGVIIHDAGHNLVSEKAWINKLVLCISNIPLLIPLSFSFKRYHFMHHVYQGIDGKDPDLPLKWEIKLIRGRWWAKVFWLAIYPIVYLFRGLSLKKKPSLVELWNWLFILTSNFILYLIIGWRGLKFLLSSAWFGYSFHPAAAHFIQEHYTFIDGQETYSYYGPLNLLFMNIGYHNEHHDLAGIPWSRLPLISALVPGMYRKLSCHKSWPKVHWDFITKGNMGPVSRVIRVNKYH